MVLSGPAELLNTVILVLAEPKPDEVLLCIINGHTRINRDRTERCL